MTDLIVPGVAVVGVAFCLLLWFALYKPPRK